MSVNQTEKSNAFLLEIKTSILVPLSSTHLIFFKPVTFLMKHFCYCLKTNSQQQIKK